MKSDNQPSGLPKPPKLPDSSFSPSPTQQKPTSRLRSSNIPNDDLEMAKKYYFGRGVSVDPSRAYPLFLQSANRGNPESARYLGIMYLRGKGVQKDTQKSLEWFSRAAQGGDEIAKKNLKTLQLMNAHK